MSCTINYLTVFLNQLDDLLSYIHTTLKIHDAGVVRQGVMTIRKIHPRLVLTQFMDYILEKDPVTEEPYYVYLINKDERFFTGQSKEDLEKRISGEDDNEKNTNILKIIELKKRWNGLSLPIKTKLFSSLNRLIKLAALSNPRHYADVLTYIDLYLQKEKEKEDEKHLNRQAQCQKK